MAVSENKKRKKRPKPLLKRLNECYNSISPANNDKSFSIVPPSDKPKKKTQSDKY